MQASSTVGSRQQAAAAIHLAREDALHGVDWVVWSTAMNQTVSM